MKKVLVLLGILFVVVCGLIVVLQMRIINGQRLATMSDNFPQVPVYGGAALQKSTCNDTQSMLFRSVWTSPEKVPQVMNWYTNELQKEGWKLDVAPGDINSESIQYAEFTRGLFNSWLGKLQLSVEAAKNGGPTKIEIGFPAPDSEHEGGD
jgi:hypothetical protein